MNRELWGILSLAAFLAYANGANDVSKGIATLAGSGLTSYPRAILWGTFWTGAGAFAGFFLARAMVAAFAQGMLTRGISPTLPATLATIGGATAWVLLATRTGLPVSTTHAILGSMTAVGAVAYGWHGIHWATLGEKIALPLLISPIASLSLSALLLLGWHRLDRIVPGTPDCLCLDTEPEIRFAAVTSLEAVSEISETPGLHVFTGTERHCKAAHPIAARLTINHLHWLTSGTTSFARGLNDAPKMVALVLPAMALYGEARTLASAAFLIVALGMLAGSWTGGRKVTTLLAEKVTRMNDREGFIANLVTASLVAPGAMLGLPMSTTHVASGAIMGAGIVKAEGVNRQTIRDMLLAWMVTLPAAAVLGSILYELLSMGTRS